MSGVKSLTVDFGVQRSEASFLSGRCNIYQVAVDHGFQLWDLGSGSPECDVASVAYTLDRGSWPWHASHEAVEQ